jgi:hypothetical protein
VCLLIVCAPSRRVAGWANLGVRSSASIVRADQHCLRLRQAATLRSSAFCHGWYESSRKINRRPQAVVELLDPVLLVGPILG